MVGCLKEGTNWKIHLKGLKSLNRSCRRGVCVSLLSKWPRKQSQVIDKTMAIVIQDLGKTSLWESSSQGTCCRSFPKLSQSGWHQYLDGIPLGCSIYTDTCMATGGIQVEQLTKWTITQIYSMMEEKQGSGNAYKDQMARLIIQEKSIH